MSTKVLVVGDMHVGSVDAIMPPIVNMYEGEEHREMELRQNELQKHLFKKWKAMCEADDYDICLCMGDLTEGLNRKDAGSNNWTNEPRIQIETAAELLKMTGAKQFFGIQGSPYHTGIEGSMDHDVLNELNGSFDEDLIVKIEGLRIHMKHVTGVASVPHSRSTSLHKDINTAQSEVETFGPLDIHLRGHTHYFHYVGWDGKLGIIVPGWKARDPFLRRRPMIGNDSGYVTIDVSNKKFSWDAQTFKIPTSVGVREVEA